MKTRLNIRPVVVSAEWGYELHECPMSVKTWKLIVKGKPFRRLEPYWYEGDRYIGEWLFNHHGFASLSVHLDDGSIKFVGGLSDTIISENEVQITWDETVLKYLTSDDLLDALIKGAVRKKQSLPPYKYWVIEDTYVTEPFLGGKQLGDLPHYDTGQSSCLTIAQFEFDWLLELFHNENGHYPDQ